MNNDINGILDHGVARQNAGDLAGAEDAYNRALQLSPDETEALQLLGGLKLQQGDLQSAQSFLERAIAATPGDAIAYINLAAVGLKKGDFDMAKAAALKGAELAPDAPPALRQLALAAEKAGDYRLAAQSLEKLSTGLGAQPNDSLKAAAQYLVARDYADAHRMIMRAMKVLPKSPIILGVWAEAAAGLNNWSEMVAVARELVSIAPDDPKSHETLARALLEAGDSHGALEAFKPLLTNQNQPDGERALIYGRICLIAQRFTEANQYIMKALEDLPTSADAHFAKARILTFQGKFDAAISACHQAIALAPDHIRAYVQLTSLLRGNLEAAQRTAMENLWSNATADVETKASLGFALGDIAFRSKEAEAALSFYRSANEMRAAAYQAQGAGYSRERTEAETQILLETAPALSDKAAKNSSLAQPAPRIVFITGMPRSGTTLTENILAAHPDVFGGGELLAGAKILDEYLSLINAPGGDPAKIFAGNAARWRDYYYEHLPDYNDASVITDKLPINFRAAPLLAALFPNAVFLNLERNPLNVGVSIYRHQFPKAYAWTHSFEDIAHFFHQCQALTTAWRTVLKGRFFTVDYAQLVERPEQETRELVSKARLDWRKECLNFHDNERTIATFSAVAARTPIAKSASASADLFTPYLADFAAALPQDKN